MPWDKQGWLEARFLLPLAGMVTAELYQSNEGKNVVHKMTEKFDQVGRVPRTLGAWGPRLVPWTPPPRHVGLQSGWGVHELRRLHLPARSRPPLLPREERLPRASRAGPRFFIKKPMNLNQRWDCLSCTAKCGYKTVLRWPPWKGRHRARLAGAHTRPVPVLTSSPRWEACGPELGAHRVPVLGLWCTQGPAQARRPRPASSSGPGRHRARAASVRLFCPGHTRFREQCVCT